MILKPNISVVIPLYNKKKHIARAIDSVIAQNVAFLEVIVVDDGSSDGGWEVVEKYDLSIVKLIRQHNCGTSVARNRGITEAKGDLIAFLDADDEWYPHYLETILNVADKFPDGGAFATAYESQEPNGRLKQMGYFGIPSSPWEGFLPNYFKSAAFGSPPVWTSAVCVPRKIFTEMGGFKEGARLGQDLEMWGRIALGYPIAFSSIVGARYYRDAENSAVKLPVPDLRPPFVETAERLIAQDAVPMAVLPDLWVYLDRLRVDAANRNVLNGYYPEASKLIKECSTSFRMKRRKVLKIYTKFPIIYKIVKVIKKIASIES